jgi:1-acyl-sn-glycerol-3-phosphate acyltransferase
LDIKRVFTDKKPGMARLIPGFVYLYLRRIVHEDELNDILFQTRDKFGFEFVSDVLKRMNADIRVHGLENIPVAGRQILVSNHPLGGFDGMALMDMIGKVRNDFYALTNDILLSLPNLRELFVPVNKHGTNQENVIILNKAFESDNLIMIFPAGLVSRKIDGKIQDLEWKNTFLARARRNQRDIIPVFVDGNNSKWFYNLAYWRKKIGIKANLEMFFLVDELVKQKNKTLNIYVSKPVPYCFFDNRLKSNDWISAIRGFVYQLKENPLITFEEYFIKKYKSNS